MLLLIVMLLSSCSKLNFSKNSKFSSSLKPYGEEGEENNNNVKSSNRNKNVEYVIGAKKSSSEKKDEKKVLSDIKVDYSEAKTLLEIKEEERKTYEKEIKEWEKQAKIDIDYSKAKTLLDIQSEEKKAKEKFERQKRLEEDKKEYSTSNQNDYSPFQYGYEKTIYGYENKFFC